LSIAAHTFELACRRDVTGGYSEDVQAPLALPNVESELASFSAVIEKVSCEIGSSVIAAWESAADILSIRAYVAVINKSTGPLRGFLRRHNGALAEESRCVATSPPYERVR